MAVPPTVAAGKAIVAKQLAQREALWSGADPWLWHRKANKGFATIPKTMPLILQIMDDLSNGKPLSSTYLALWCDTWDNSMVNLSKPQEMAHAAGFTGQRAVYTWRTRMLLLKELLFIDIKPGKSGDISHVLIWNPHLIIRMHQQKKTPGLTEAAFNALLERALDIGAKDIVEPFPVVAAAPPPPTPPTNAASAEMPTTVAAVSDADKAPS
ncbi:hypothetical protein [Bradyrhizobium monzae]|uniref:hypothetical protein n=1 Tax=Bradyrhizobium sp. Oc8 TaxID=2876780 RepID=UPI001F17AF8A|nr:hypothetical protein [Bradyrhizobium sp. Oc8]